MQGQYIVKVFPDSLSYPTLAPSYYSTNYSQYLWDSATVINHTCANNISMNIIMAETITFSGTTSLSGNVYEGVGFLSLPNNPVPNVDMKLAHLPSLEIISSTKTNSSGFYTFSNMPFGAYYIFADIPGLNFGTPYIRVTDTAHLSYTQLDYYINCSTITPTSPLSVATINNTEEFITIAPNPFTSQTTISFSSEQTNTTIKITDILGKEIKALNFSGKYCTIEKSTMQAGIYFVKIIDVNKNVVNRKIVVQ